MNPIVLIRHAVGEHNLRSDDECDTDSYDALLTPAGRREAELHGFNILNTIKKNKITIFTSPLRRCLQTCYYMLKSSPKRLRYEKPKPLALLIENDEWESSSGHTVQYLRQHFHGFDWSELYQGNVPDTWWNLSFRMNRSRLKECMNVLQDQCLLTPVVAFTHGNFIRSVTKISVHNCEAVVSYDSGKTWSKLYEIGKSLSRLNERRKKRC